MTSSTWFITGASSGMGRSAMELLLEGHRVAAAVRRPEPVAELCERYRDRLWIAMLDVTDTAAVHAVVDRAFKDLGSIDVILSAAGYGQIGAAEELSDEEITRQLNTNLVGSIQVAKAALPHLRAQGRGRIVQISSMGGQAAFIGAPIYHASKWGIEGFLDLVAIEVAAFGIEIVIVEPGNVATDFSTRSISVLAADRCV